jgi:hypothetical protein
MRIRTAPIKGSTVSFEEARKIFDGPVLTREDDREDYGEERFLSLGMIGVPVVVMVAHTDRADVIRIISARKATKTEQRIYHEKLKESTY